MAHEAIRVGLVGASPGRGWAAVVQEDRVGLDRLAARFDKRVGTLAWSSYMSHVVTRARARARSDVLLAPGE